MNTPLDLPSHAELEQLPRRAREAYAARCARRVLSRIGAQSDVGAEDLRALEAALHACESGSLPPGADACLMAVEVAKAIDQARVSCREAYEAAQKVASAVVTRSDHGKRSTTAADDQYQESVRLGTAYAAANSAASALLAPGTIGPTAPAACAWGAAEDAATAAGASRSAVVQAMRSDFEKLSAEAKRERWNDETNVPPDFFRALWPNGVPAGWPAESSPSRCDLGRFERAVRVLGYLLKKVAEGAMRGLFNRKGGAE